MPDATIIDGNRIAAAIRGELAVRIVDLKARRKVPPRLAAVLVGDDPASHVYVRNKRRACREVGLESSLVQLPIDVRESELLELIHALNRDAAVHGILVQLPLPQGISRERILDAIDPLKDVDGFHPENVGLMLQGRPRYLPCTPLGIQALLARSGLSTSGKHVVVVGRSDIVGKPLAVMLVQRTSPYGPEFANASVTICHSRSADLLRLVRSAEFVVAATGVPGLITGDMLAPGAVVVDVGIHRTPQGLVGDVNFASAIKIASWITPVPGGVGPMTIAMLLANTLRAAEMQTG